MATRFRRDGVWYIRHKDTDGKWKNVSCGPAASAHEAETIRMAYEGRELNARHHSPVRIVSTGFYDDLETFRKTVLPRSDIGRIKSPRGIRREQVVIENFVPWAQAAGMSRYDDCTTERFAEYFEHLHTLEKSPRTIREERRVLTKFFRWAIETFRAKVNPVEKIAAPKKVKRPPRFFSREELDKIFSNAKPPYANIYRFLYVTGLRIGELGNLEWSDISEAQRFASIRVMVGNKTKREETIHLNAAAVRILSEQKEWRDKVNTEDSKRYPFTNASGQKLDNDNIYRNLMRLLKDQGILRASPHTFRHTCASHLVIDGVSLYVVKEVLRHASIKETEVYAHLSREAVDNAVEKLKA